MDYIELNISISPYNDQTIELATAELNELGYEGFVETETGIIVYIKSENFDTKALTQFVDQFFENEIIINYEKSKIQNRNWNEEWEKNFDYVIIDDKCLIKAHFHKDTPTVQYEILIDPKMSFGTGHHETTSLMISEMLKFSFTDKTVLDMGCWTGVLAILAEKLGASRVVAIDYDEWAFENTSENIKLNNAVKIQAIHGTAENLTDEVFDVILANITKNVILNDLSKYVGILAQSGIFLCSGFYQSDLDDIQSELWNYNVSLDHFQLKNNWVTAYFVKN